jgi:hypothetical protein
LYTVIGVCVLMGKANQIAFWLQIWTSSHFILLLGVCVLVGKANRIALWMQIWSYSHIILFIYGGLRVKFPAFSFRIMVGGRQGLVVTACSWIVLFIGFSICHTTDMQIFSGVSVCTGLTLNYGLDGAWHADSE